MKINPPSFRGSLDVAFRNREAMAARSRGRKPTECGAKRFESREAAAANIDPEIAVAASRLSVLFLLEPLG
jgi:hypothetical protein